MVEGTPAPDKRPSDRLTPPDVAKTVGACPAFDEIKDDDTLQAVLKDLNLSAADFELILSFQGVPPAQIAFFISGGALSYRFSLIRSQEILSGKVKGALDYIRGRVGKKLFEHVMEDQKPTDSVSSPSGAHRLPSLSPASEAVDQSQRLSDLGYTRDEVIGGVMALGAISTAPNMIIAFWERSLVEIAREVPETYRSLLQFFQANRRTTDAASLVGVRVREGVQEVVVRRPDSGRLPGFDTHGDRAGLKASDLIQHMANQGLPVPPESLGDLTAQAEDAHDKAARAIAQMNAKLAQTIDAPPQKPEDKGGGEVTIQ